MTEATRPRVFVARRLPEPVMAQLRERYRLMDEPSDEPPARERLLAGLKEADAAICTLTERMDDDALSAGRRLRIVANYAVGFNNIDLAAAARRGIIVSNTPDVLTDATADLTWALLLAVARRVTEGHSIVQQRVWTGWAPTQLLGADVTGRTLGIIGLGRIGRAVAERAAGFRMPILYTARQDIVPGVPDTWRRGSLRQVLEQSDFVCLHVPLSDETRHLIDALALSLMRRSAYLINTSRGPVIDEAALAHALKQGLLAGAGLDVYEREPAIHHDLLDHPHVVTLPHLGSATWRTRVRMGEICLENLDAVLSGRPAPNQVT
ncbi:MAG: D-glycerate dehydrogenase [Nitrospiraceae bacterium]